MKKVALVFTALLLLLPLAASAQFIDDEFNGSLGEWVDGYGDWQPRGGMMVQRDTTTGLARAQRPAAQRGEVEYSFLVRYEAGGFEDEAALRAQEFHAGFGIHVGVENPPRAGAPAWGAGDSYLLWLNLDTRPDTHRNAREHFGFRGQVYRSRTNARMSLMDSFNVDIPAALSQAGYDVDIEDIDRFLGILVPIKIRVNYSTGRIMVSDPTNPSLWFWFDVDPSVLRGDHVVLRTNSLAVSFANFTATRR
ncbi:MAG: hypothetical protein ACOC2Y_01435 [Spirochaetota bacterium]